MLIGQSNLLQALGWAVFNSLWQMAILWVVYQLIVPVFRIKKSAHKNSLAAILLIGGFAWFVFTFIAIFANASGAGEGYVNSYAELVNISANAELNNWLNTTLPIASVIYLLLLVFPILNFIRNYRYVQVIRRYGLSRAEVQWRVFVQKTAAQMGIHKPVHVWMSELISSPVTIGYIKPIILLPLAAINHLSPQQVEAVLLHELSHIRRYDYFINLLAKLIQTILYFNPFVKAFARIIEREREKSCDATVMQFQYEPHGYASALLVLEKAAHVTRHSLAVAASDGNKSEFRQRIEWILGIDKKPVFSFNKLAGVMAALLCFIGLNALLILANPHSNEPQNDPISFLSSPYEFFNDGGGYDKTTNALIVAEKPAKPITNEPGVVPQKENEQEPVNSAIASNEDKPAQVSSSDEEETASPFSFVYRLQNIIPQLDAKKEKQVQEAIAESKRVIQDIQWKEVEKSIADALTSVEKEKVKEEYNKAIDNIDWQKIGDNLRISYNNIDWKQMNAQLDQALAAIKIDSLQQVYSVAIDNLCDIQRELVRSKQKGIPDSDLTLQSIEMKKHAIEKMIEHLKKSRPRKIVQL